MHIFINIEIISFFFSKKGENEINNFKILDPNGKPVEGLESEIRTVWREVCATDNADFIVIVKPATWLQMSNYDDDEDDDYDREDVTSHY